MICSDKGVRVCRFSAGSCNIHCETKLLQVSDARPWLRNTRTSLTCLVKETVQRVHHRGRKGIAHYYLLLLLLITYCLYFSQELQSSIPRIRRAVRVCRSRVCRMFSAYCRSRRLVAFVAKRVVVPRVPRRCYMRGLPYHNAPQA